ncbi:hypothetical protein [Bifidobacterium biavatii]|uniref:Molecular chaperone n=1 Tax=Bifidobacterium biavatii DSM 23969 TaxID=1437608 RepID=A0A086ZHV5_9BIFI|nr:hypothetical protein [Bifidobacterium biavatii]KFI46105.1 hypothetical protein BBIA_2070 [Bifidobacterium biavatii DSM 23969]
MSERRRLSPRLKPVELSRMCADPEHWADLTLIADHPSAWPALQDWIDHALDVGPENAGEPPLPPDGWKRGYNQRPPKYAQTDEPEQPKTGKPEPQSDPVPDMADELMAVSDPSTSSSVVPAPKEQDEPGITGDAEETESGKTVTPSIEDVTPQRTAAWWVRRIMPVAVAMLALACLIGGGMAVHAAVSWQAQQTIEQERQRNEKRDRAALAKAIDRAERMTKRVTASPVSDDAKVAGKAAALETLARSDDEDPAGLAKRIDKARESLSDAWDKAMKTKAKTVGAELDRLVDESDSLKTFDHPDRTEMTDLANKWRIVVVDEDNLTDAAKDAARLKELTGTITAAKNAFDKEAGEKTEAAKRKADEEARKKAEAETAQQQAEQSQTSSTPSYTPTQTQTQQQSQTTVPQTTSPSTGSPGSGSSSSQSSQPAPSWNVAPDRTSGSSSLPGSDGSL